MDEKGTVILSDRGVGWMRFAGHGAAALMSLGLTITLGVQVATGLGLHPDESGVLWPAWQRYGLGALSIALGAACAWFFKRALGRNVIKVVRNGGDLVLTELAILGPSTRRIALADITGSRYRKVRVTRAGRGTTSTNHQLVLDCAEGPPADVDLRAATFDTDAWREIAPKAMAAWEAKTPDEEVG